MSGWIFKNPTIYIQETHFRFKDTNRLNVKGTEEDIMQAASNHKTARMTILISDKIDSRTRESLHNDKRINPLGRCNNYNHMCT